MVRIVEAMVDQERREDEGSGVEVWVGRGKEGRGSPGLWGRVQ